MTPGSTQASIDNLDLDDVVHAAQVANDWTDETAQLASRRYRDFLYVCWFTLSNLKRGASISIAQVSLLADQVWHHHILFTAKYQRDCHDIFGTYLNHEALPPTLPHSEIERLQDTARRYFQAAGRPYVDTNDPDHNPECAWCQT
jgi:hypothetical protein